MTRRHICGRSFGSSSLCSLVFLFVLSPHRIGIEVVTVFTGWNEIDDFHLLASNLSGEVPDRWHRRGHRVLRALGIGRSCFLIVPAVFPTNAVFLVVLWVVTETARRTERSSPAAHEKN